jgi:hypothetical protein
MDIFLNAFEIKSHFFVCVLMVLEMLISFYNYYLFTFSALMLTLNINLEFQTCRTTYGWVDAKKLERISHAWCTLNISISFPIFLNLSAHQQKVQIKFVDFQQKIIHLKLHPF